MARPLNHASLLPASETPPPRWRMLVFGIVISVLCLAMLRLQVDFKESWTVAKRLHGPMLWVPCMVVLCNLPMRAWRWRLIYPENARPTYGSCLTVLGIGNMLNFLLPARAGDLVRCVYGGRTSSLEDSTQTLATMIVEKILDGSVLLVLVLYSLWTMTPSNWLMDLVRVLMFVFGGAFVFLLLFQYQTQRWIRYTVQLLGFLGLSWAGEKVETLMTSFSGGLAVVTRSVTMIQLFVLTSAIWASESILIWGLSAALSVPISIKSAIVVTAVLGAGAMVPAAPGGFGTYELFGTQAFKWIGVNANAGLALTLVIHAWVFLSNIATGLCLLGINKRLGWRNLIPSRAIR